MYSAPITRENPTAFVLLVDQSGSMAERTVFADQSMSKARAVSLVVGSFVDELLHRARREGGVRDYYDIAVLGYSGEGVRSLLPGTSMDSEWARPSKLAVARVERQSIARERLLPSGRSVVAVREHNVWIPERAEGLTPMCGALRAAAELVEGWCRQGAHRASYPPTVINITDGEASDGGAGGSAGGGLAGGNAEIRALAERIRGSGTEDGNTLLLNVHLFQNDGSSGAGSVLFPSSEEELPPHRYARLLWDISSDVPSRGGRGVGFNCDFASLAAAMNIGSVNSLIL